MLLALLVVSCVYLYRFMQIIMNYEDAIEESLEVLDNAYGNIAKVLEIPVGSDDPFVRTVISEIKRSHDAVLSVANKLTESAKQE